MGPPFSFLAKKVYRRDHSWLRCNKGQPSKLGMIFRIGGGLALTLGKDFSQDGPPGGIPARRNDTCIFHFLLSLMGLNEARYRIIVFREVHLWQPILTPGEPQTIELQNAEMLGRWGNLPPQLSFEPRLFSRQSMPAAPIPEANDDELQQASWRPVDGTGRWPKTEIRKKKGGAMNAPPLKGSDTSVSSPKRQTAEAVRKRASRERANESSEILHARYSH